MVLIALIQLVVLCKLVNLLIKPSSPKRVTMITKQHLKLLDDIEKLLVWINEKQFKGDFVSEDIMFAKGVVAEISRKAHLHFPT